MGIVLEYYRVPDEIIEYYIQQPDHADLYFDEYYNNFGGKYHEQPKWHFHLYKDWDIVLNLCQLCDKSEKHLTQYLIGTPFIQGDTDSPRYLKSKLVADLYQVLSTISDEEIEQIYFSDKLKEVAKYRFEAILAHNFEDHLKIVKAFFLVFEIAFKNHHGLVAYFC